MATSSLKKSFVIDSAKEADAFVQLFADSMKNPPKPIKDVNYSVLSKEEVRKIVVANAKRS